MASGLDEDTVRTVQRGRETLGTTFSAAQSHLQKVFLVFVAGLLGSIMILQYGLWDVLQRDLLYRKMGISTAEETRVIFVTPFDVILLQIKIGLVVGILLAVPVLIYYSRDGLRERGLWPSQKIPTWKLAAFASAITFLFVGGVLYAYELFFPLMFSFLAGNALQAGFLPHYSIVKWFQFVILLALSFGLAAQLPLMMTTLTYTGIVAYETFRDKWKYAVVIIFAFGSIFSPPDPFTQIMWALPLCLLYVISLGLSKLVSLLKRAGREVDWRLVARQQWNQLAGAIVLSGGVVYYIFATEAFTYVQALAEAFPSQRLTGDIQPPAWFGLGVEGTALVIGAFVGGIVALAVLYYYVVKALDVAAVEAGNFGDPTEIDVGELTASAVRAAPPEAFEEMDESTALQHADTALQADDDEKAQAILQRFDAAQERVESEGDGDDAGAEGATGDDDEGGEGGVGGIFSSTATGMADAFTGDETSEDDIGGYYYDIRFVLDTLRSRAFRIVGTFMVLMVGIFGWLYYGGFRELRDNFIARIPADVQPLATGGEWPITLHPVEALVFQVKISVVLAAIGTLPVIVYYVWPALQDRGWVTGDRRTIIVWGGGLVGGLLLGSYLGYTFAAPEVISFLVYDALESGMIISFTVSTFAWMVFLLTAGIGILIDVPVTMVLFHLGGLVSYETMRRRWRVPVISAFAFGALVTPDSLYTMLVIALPIVFMYFVGLAILTVITLGGRRGGSTEPESTRTA